MRRILIIGATSSIATACARRWCAEEPSFFLVARDAGRLEALCADLRVRGATAVHGWKMDATDITAHDGMIEAAVQALGGLDIVLISHGTWPSQAACERDVAVTMGEFATNCTSVIALLTALARIFERQRSGCIAVITSMAGDRPHPTNYVYGSAKAAVSAFCEGLRARLGKFGVTVSDIRPGFVATPMTEQLALPAALVSRPERIASAIVRGIDHRRRVIYAPAFWLPMVTVARHIPQFKLRLTL